MSEKMNYEITNTITPEEYLEMRTSVGWSLFPLEQAADGLEHTAHICCIRNKENGQPLALGRMLWDHGYRIMVSLKAAKNKEGFYKKFGFIERPNEDFGPGMHQWIES